MDDAARAWRPSRGWATTVDAVVHALKRDPTDCGAWCQLAMMFGDTRAPELALIVYLHACTLDEDHPQVRAHLDLCLLDLGLGNASTSPVPLIALGERGTVTSDPAALTGWCAEHLASYDGDVARAARHALAIAVARFAG